MNQSKLLLEYSPPGDGEPVRIGEMSFLEFCETIRAVEVYITDIAGNKIAEVKDFCQLHTMLSAVLRAWTSEDGKISVHPTGRGLPQDGKGAADAAPQVGL